MPCHLPRRLVKVSSRLEGSALGTALLETSPNQSLLSSHYWCSMAVPEDRLTTSNPSRSSPIVGARSSSTISWGGGNSDQPNDPSLWRVELFLEELATVRQELGLDHIHLLGHSWGGMLAMEYALTQPTGLASLILSS